MPTDHCWTHWGSRGESPTEPGGWTGTGVHRASGLQLWPSCFITFPTQSEPLESPSEARTAPPGLKALSGTRDHGLWGKAHTPRQVTGRVGGEVQPALGRKAHPGILHKPGHEGQAHETPTRQAQRRKKTILTHRGGMSCGEQIQAAGRQGGVRTTAAIGGDREKTQERKENKSKNISTQCIDPASSVTKSRLGLTTRLAWSHSIRDL